MYNVLAEVCVFILSLILTVSVYLSFSFYIKRHRIFLICVLSIVASTGLNIASIYIINYFKPDFITWGYIVTSLYFAFLILTPYLFIVYSYYFVSSTHKHETLYTTLVVVPYWIYLGLVVSNLWTGWLFSYDAINGYVRGPLKNVTYITMGIYQLIEVLTVYHNHRKISKHIKVVFFLYPVIALAIMLIQFRFTWYVMTGTAVFAPLLLIYLTIQSELAEVDVSTGLFTGKMLEHELGHSVTGAVCYIAIDDYSDLMENLGSDNARQLEFQISKRLIDAYGTSVYYLDGGRYIVIAEDQLTIKAYINDILRESTSFTTDNNFTFRLELHAAVFSVPDNAVNYGQAMELAVDLIQFAKTHKQRICYCDEDYQNQCARDAKIYEILLRELHQESEQLQVYYQPIWSIKEQKFTYAEALSRLFNTELGTIRPDEFIRIAENKGLIERLGNVTFDKICQFLSTNRDVLKAVSVNFSVYQMMNPNVVSNVLGTIQKYGLKPENIIMEITESIFIDDLDTIRDHMVQLSDAGIIFYLDDFGTGYSNFANVLNLPFSTIKVDRSLVRTMENDQRNYQFLKNLMYSFKSNGMSILTEGVETDLQDSMVKEAGTDYIQGFLYSKPISGSDCITLIRES